MSLKLPIRNSLIIGCVYMYSYIFTARHSIIIFKKNGIIHYLSVQFYLNILGTRLPAKSLTTPTAISKYYKCNIMSALCS